MNIDKERTKDNFILLNEITNIGYPHEVLKLMLSWRKRKYIQLQLFKVQS